VADSARRAVLRKGLRLLVRAVREEPRIFTVALAGAVLVSVLTVGSAYVMGTIVARVVAPALDRGEADAGLLALAAAALVGVSLLKVVGMVGRRLGSGYMHMRLQASYRRQVTHRYLELPVAWHHRHPTGALLSNASSDVESSWLPANTLAFALATVVMLAAALGSLFVTDWVFGLIGLAVFPTLFGLYLVYSRQVAASYANVAQLRSEVAAIAHESFDGAVVVKSMGREAHETARFAAKVAQLRDKLVAVGRVRGLYDPIVDSLSSIGTLAVLLAGAWRLRDGAIGVSELVSAAFVFALLDIPVRAIGWLLTSLPFAVAGWDRVQQVLTATGRMEYGETVLAPAGGSSGDAPSGDASGGAPSSGAPAGSLPAQLRFEGVELAHEPGRPVLREVSFTLPAGRALALVGPTGSGKSTIASLAARLVDPTAGGVTLDGVDLRQLTAASLASTVALVPQVPFVFDDTVRANVALDRAGIDDERVWAALRAAQADGFVARLPDGLDSVLGERGVVLSGGQRQRLTLARALAGQPRLLVLDDATSAVDPRVEAAILASLRAGGAPGGAAGGPGHSILVIAYRRATIALADEVVYLDQGQVVATGSHAELLASVPGYADLVTAYEKAEAERVRTHAYDSEAEPARAAVSGAAA